MHEFIRKWLESNGDCTSNLRHAVTDLLADRDRLADQVERVRLMHTMNETDDEVQMNMERLTAEEQQQLQGLLERLPRQNWLSLPHGIVARVDLGEAEDLSLSPSDMEVWKSIPAQSLPPEVLEGDSD